MESLCIAVPLRKGEEVRKALLDAHLLNKELALYRDAEFLYLPIIEGQGKKEFMGYKVLERDFQELKKEAASYKEYIELPSEIAELLPTSFDMVGSVAIVKLQDPLMDHKKAIGNAILKAQKSARTVALDFGVEGEARVRNLEIIAGDASTETVHREYGIELETDPAFVYFSPRLATEHWRVAQLVQEREVVIDMFCGIGPFSVLIAKNRGPKKIYAIDINPKALDYLKRNIKRNKVHNIMPILGDSRKMVPQIEGADRIIMNLPHSAFEFIPTALSNIQNNGTIHYYEILDHDKKERRIDEIKGVARKNLSTIIQLGLREVHTYSPASGVYCFDLKVEKNESNL